MGQEQSSGANISPQQPQERLCRPCNDWGNKKYNTVKVDAAALGIIDKENDPNGQVLNGKDPDCEAEAARLAEEQRRVEEARREMERRVKEEQERQLAEQQRREAERRRLLLEQQAREREEKEQQLQELRRKAELEKQRQQQEFEEKVRLQQEERQKKIKDMEDQKKVRAWLRSNGFKNVNDLVRKRFAKVTPLHAAVGLNNPEMVKLLLAAGADPKKVNGKSETPTKLAHKLNTNGNHEAVIRAFATQ
jgi:flagellar biosynthesis GTPase FlhF